MKWIARLGAWTLGLLQTAGMAVSIGLSSVQLAFRPSSWSLATRNVLARQVLFTAVEAIPFISFMGILVGLSIVLQASVWLDRIGQVGLLGPILVTTLVRELGPVITGMVIIGRSGAAITTELGNMRVHGEDRVLDAQGVDSFIYLVMPRVIGMMISLFCLTIVFLIMAFFTGFIVGRLLNLGGGASVQFVDAILSSLKPVDIINLVTKTLIPGLLIGAVTCMEGLKIGDAVTQVPQAVTRALVRAVGALFLVSAIVSILSYGVK